MTLADSSPVYPSTGWTFKRAARPKPTSGPREPRGRLLANAAGEVRVRASGGKRNSVGPGWMAGEKPGPVAKLDTVAAATAAREAEGGPALLRSNPPLLEKRGVKVKWREDGRVRKGKVVGYRRKSLTLLVKVHGQRRPVEVPIRGGVCVVGSEC